MRKWIFQGRKAKTVLGRDDGDGRRWRNPARGRPTPRWHEPATLTELAAAMAAADPTRPIVPVGSRCSFSAIDEGEATRINLTKLDVGKPASGRAACAWRSALPLKADAALWPILDARLPSATATRVDRRDAGRYLWRLPAATTLTAAIALLKKHGQSLHNLGQVAYQTVAGATQTGTHGSGIGHGNVSCGILALEIMTAGGKHVRVEPTDGITVANPADTTLVQDDATFNAAVVGGGMFGAVTAVVVGAVDLWHLREERTVLWVDAALDRLPELVRTTDHVEVLLNPYHDTALVIARHRAPPSVDRRGCCGHRRRRGCAFWAPRWLRRAGASALPCCARSRQTAGAAIDALLLPQADAHFEDTADRVLTNTVSEDARVVSSESAVPIRGADDRGYVEAIKTVRAQLRDFATPVNMPMNVRFVRADPFPLSANYHGGDPAVTATCFVEIIVSLDDRGSAGAFGAFAEIEKLLVDAFGARPHPGKAQRPAAWAGAPHVAAAAAEWRRQLEAFWAAHAGGKTPVLTPYLEALTAGKNADPR